jgi:hypothetical protein
MELYIHFPAALIPLTTREGEYIWLPIYRIAHVVEIVDKGAEIHTVDGSVFMVSEAGAEILRRAHSKLITRVVARP